MILSDLLASGLIKDSDRIRIMMDDAVIVSGQWFYDKILALHNRRIGSMSYSRRDGIWRVVLIKEGWDCLEQ